MPYGFVAATASARCSERPESDGSPASVTSGSPLDNFKEFGLGKSNQEPRVKADGQLAKKRGPKPDAKPAMNRRQELNRQAQRTHRERKELYIQALEKEVLTLREQYGTAAKELDIFRAAFAKVKQMLTANGIPCPPELASLDTTPTTSSGSFSGSYAQPTPSTTASDRSSDPVMNGNGGYFDQSDQNSPPVPSTNGSNGSHVQLMPNSHFDVNQVGINFVLALERPCMDHMKMLCVKAHNSDGPDISGHVLMASCPPASDIENNPEAHYPHQIPPNTEPSQLLKLLDMSSRLPLLGEITPVMAWAQIRRDRRFPELDEKDILDIMNELLPKVRCYGFGAVLEEFEVKDALEGFFAIKFDMFAAHAA